MAKKLVTQVLEWLQETVGEKQGGELVSDRADQFRWAIKSLTTVDKRDSQNRKPRKRKVAK